jgi:hypothetical protein
VVHYGRVPSLHTTSTLDVHQNGIHGSYQRNSESSLKTNAQVSMHVPRSQGLGTETNGPPAGSCALKPLTMANVMDDLLQFKNCHYHWRKDRKIQDGFCIFTMLLSDTCNLHSEPQHCVLIWQIFTSRCLGVCLIHRHQLLLLSKMFIPNDHSQFHSQPTACSASATTPVTRSQRRQRHQPHPGSMSTQRNRIKQHQLRTSRLPRMQSLPHVL